MSSGQLVQLALEPGSAIARQLSQLAEDRAWEQGQDRSLSVARAIYLHLPDGYKLWVRGRDFGDLYAARRSARGKPPRGQVRRAPIMPPGVPQRPLEDLMTGNR